MDWLNLTGPYYHGLTEPLIQVSIIMDWLKLQLPIIMDWMNLTALLSWIDRTLQVPINMDYIECS